MQFGVRCTYELYSRENAVVDIFRFLCILLVAFFGLISLALTHGFGDVERWLTS